MAKKPVKETGLVLRPSAALAELRKLFDPSLVSASVDASGGGIAPFLKLEDGVIMDGQNDLGDELDLIILGIATEHALFPGAYVANQISEPTCFYVGKTDKGAAPDPKSPVKQAASCADCPKNAFGSASNGRKGKACTQRRRLLVLPLGDQDDPAKAPLRRLRVPPTSTKFIDGYVKMVESFGPLQAVVTRLTLVQDKTDRFHATFAPHRVLEPADVEAAAARLSVGEAELFASWTPSDKPAREEKGKPPGRRVVRG